MASDFIIWSLSKHPHTFPILYTEKLLALLTRVVFLSRNRPRFLEGIIMGFLPAGMGVNDAGSGCGGGPGARLAAAAAVPRLSPLPAGLHLQEQPAPVRLQRPVPGGRADAPGHPESQSGKRLHLRC